MLSCREGTGAKGRARGAVAAAAPVEHVALSRASLLILARLVGDDRFLATILLTYWYVVTGGARVAQ